MNSRTLGILSWWVRKEVWNFRLTVLWISGPSLNCFWFYRQENLTTGVLVPFHSPLAGCIAKTLIMGFVFCSPTTVSVHLGQCSSRSMSPFRSASTSVSVHLGQCSPRSVSVRLGQCSPRSVSVSVSQCPSRSVFTSISVHLGQCLSRSVSVRLGQCSPRSVSVHFSRLVKVSQRAVCGSACFVLSCGLFFEWRGLYLGALRGLV